MTGYGATPQLRASFTPGGLAGRAGAPDRRTVVLVLALLAMAAFVAIVLTPPAPVELLGRRSSVGLGLLGRVRASSQEEASNNMGDLSQLYFAKPEPPANPSSNDAQAVQAAEDRAQRIKEHAEQLDAKERLLEMATVKAQEEQIAEEKQLKEAVAAAAKLRAIYGSQPAARHDNPYKAVSQRNIKDQVERALSDTVEANTDVKEDQKKKFFGNPGAWPPNPFVQTGSTEQRQQQPAQLGAKATARPGFIPWQDPMGTDISFIQTSTYPTVMRGSEHNNHPLLQKPLEQPQPQPQLRGAVSSQADDLATRVASLVMGQLEPAIAKQEAEIHSLEKDAATPKMRVAKAPQLSIADYGFEKVYPGGNPMHALAPENQEWVHEEAKGGPCNHAGACNHGSMAGVDPRKARKHYLERYAEGMDGNGHAIDGAEPTNETSAEEEEFHFKLGQNVMMKDMDDYVTVNDAYSHNMLTSGTAGYDHFAHFAPMSKENDEIMYGSAYNSSEPDLVLGGSIHPSPDRGGVVENAIGDHQVGAPDSEVPVGMSQPDFPGRDPDRLGSWPADSEVNQVLVNGAYWRILKQDGVLDREMPAQEAHDQQFGASHDRQPIPDLFLNNWHDGFGYGAKEGKQPFERARAHVHGDDWRSKVNTGTHEEVERHIGIVGNMGKPGHSYFKRIEEGQQLHGIRF